MEHQLYGRDYTLSQEPRREIRDYSTGLVYQINEETGVCVIKDMSDESSLGPVPPPEISKVDYNDPNQFFSLTDVTYQYSGMVFTLMPIS
jgi:hypothetical protein